MKILGMLQSRERLTWLLWGVVLFVAVRFALWLPEAAKRPSHGFVAYYTASKLLAEGADSSQFYDVVWFKAQIARFQPLASDVHINPPTTNLLLLPLVGLDYTGARLVWTIFSLICLAGVAWWWIRTLPLSGPEIPLLWILLLWNQPAMASFYLGQTYLFLLALLVVAWVGYRQGWGGVMGVALALLLLLKLAGVFLWLLLLAQRQWRVLAWGTAVSLSLFLISLPWLGWPAWLNYLELLRGFASQPERAVTAYQTIPSLFAHLFTLDAQWNPHPLWVMPGVGDGLTWLVTAVLLLLSTLLAVKTAGQNHLRDLHFAIFTTLSIILSPLALDYHYPLLLLPVVLLWVWLGRLPTRQKWMWRLVLGTAVFAIVADLPYRSPRLAGGAWALLAYPKLYGALLLWVLAAWGIWRESRN